MKLPAKLLLLPAILLASMWQKPAARAGVEVVRPARGRALICFYREVSFHGNCFCYSLADGGKAIGSLPTESCFFYEAETGEHTFRVGLLRHGSVTLNVKAGRIYYLRCLPAAEVFYAQPELELVPVVEGAAVAATLRPRLAAR